MGNKSKAAPRRIQENFRDLVVAATKANTGDFITQQVVRAGQIIAKDLAEQLKPYDLLFVVFQDLLIEQQRLLSTLIGGLTPLSVEVIKNMVFDKEDSFLGLTKSEELKVGDRVRFKLTDKDKPGSTQLVAIGKLGSTPAELNADVEAAMVGMKINEIKAITVKIQDKDYNFEVEILRNSTPTVAETPTNATN